MQEPSKSATRVLWPLAILFATVTHAAPFDERVKAPKSATPQELQTRFRAHFDTIQRKQEERPGAFVRDQAAHKQWSDLYFSVIRAMDEGRPLANLSAFGLIANPDGSYTVDLKKFPQWAPLDSRLFVLTNPEVLESFVPALRARGFRDVDVEAMRTYVATHDPRQMTFAEGRQLVDTFARRLQSRQGVRQPLDLEEVMAYRYQKTNIRREAERQWAVGLLDALDNQRQRILASFFEELDSTDSFGAPSEPLSRTLEREIQPLISGDYVQLIEEEAAAIKKESERRAEELMGGQQK